MSIKAVIDTNVFVSAFWSRNIESPPRRIYRALMEQRFTPLYSEEIISEYNDVLHRRKFGFRTEEIDGLITIIRNFGEKIFPAASDGETFPDPDDKIFYCVALAAQSDSALLVTGNARHFPQTPFIITPTDFAAQFC